MGVFEKKSKNNAKNNENMSINKTSLDRGTVARPLFIRL